MSNQTTSQLRIHLAFSIWNRLRALKQSLRLGKLGKQVFIDKNVSFLRFPKNIFINDEVVVKQGVQICACNHKASINIGERTTVGFYTFVYSSESIVIGNDCLIAPFVYIVDSDHSIERDKPINAQPNQTQRIIIEDDVWIATGAKVLKGVRIGQGSVIAAGAVVKDDVPPYSIVGGIPAKIIGSRS